MPRDMLGGERVEEGKGVFWGFESGRSDSDLSAKGLDLDKIAARGRVCARVAVAESVRQPESGRCPAPEHVARAQTAPDEAHQRGAC